jgi:glycosyltransferase involved in cell wall biosynthesis
MQNNLRLSVVVCTYKRPALLKKCLRSLAVQTLDRRLFEVIVVNNDPETDPSQITALYPDDHTGFRVTEERDVGISSARNRGWQEATGEFVAYIDDDAQAAPDWAGRILNDFIRIHPVPFAVGGKVLPVYATRLPFWFSDELETFSLGETAHFRSSARARYGFIGSNMAFTREVLEQSGGFSRNYGMLGPVIRLGEETELFTRIHRNYPGRFWYDPELRVRHCVSGRSMHLMSRCIRSFYSGRALAAIDAAEMPPHPFPKKILHLIRIVPALPYRILVFRRGIPAELVISLQDLCERLGYLHAR